MAPLRTNKTFVENYRLLSKLYRQGKFEALVGVHPAKKSLVADVLNSSNSILETSKFEGNCETTPIHEDVLEIRFTVDQKQVEVESISFEDATEVFYHQLRKVKNDQLSSLVNPETQLLIFGADLLVYELFDYFLITPSTIKKLFFDELTAVSEAVKIDGSFVKYVEARFVSDGSPKTRLDSAFLNEAKKKILLAAFFGANASYRSHDSTQGDAIDRCRTVLQFITKGKSEEEYPHSLIGLGNYVLGNLLRTTENYEDAETAFHKSIHHYTQRVIANDRLRDLALEATQDITDKSDYLDENSFREKQLLALRRAALVSGLGLSYLYSINSRLVDAQRAITMARAVSRQNSGKIYSCYIDLMYHSVNRALYSSDKTQLLIAIAGLRKCLDTYELIAPGKNYHYRAHTELALALHYLAQMTNPEDRSRLYEEIEGLLQKVCDFSLPGNKSDSPKNPRLLAETLYIRSHIRRHMGSEVDLSKAFLDAEESHKLVTGRVSRVGEIKQLQSDAMIACASCHLTRAEKSISTKGDVDENIIEDLEQAHIYLEAALLANTSNKRIIATCYLKFVKLYLLRKETHHFAYYYFNKYKQIEKYIEHAYVKDGAKQFQSRSTAISIENSFFISAFETPLNLNASLLSLKRYLVDMALNRLVEENYAELNPKSFRRLTTKQLMKELGIEQGLAYKIYDRKPPGLHLEPVVKRLLGEFHKRQIRAY